MNIVGTEELCKIMAGEGNPPLTKPRITQLEKEGMPKYGRDQWDIGRCLFWYLGKLRRSVKARRSENEDGTSTSVEQERKRLIRFQADRAEIEAAKSRGNVIAVHDHERILADMAQTIKAHIRSIGPRIAQDLVGETSRTMIQARLEKAHDEALRYLSDTVPRYEAAQTPSQNVGRPKGSQDKSPRAKRATK